MYSDLDEENEVVEGGDMLFTGVLVLGFGW